MVTISQVPNFGMTELEKCEAFEEIKGLARAIDIEEDRIKYYMARIAAIKNDQREIRARMKFKEATLGLSPDILSALVAYAAGERDKGKHTFLRGAVLDPVSMAIWIDMQGPAWLSVDVPGLDRNAAILAVEWARYYIPTTYGKRDEDEDHG